MRIKLLLHTSQTNIRFLVSTSGGGVVFSSVIETGVIGDTNGMVALEYTGDVVYGGGVGNIIGSFTGSGSGVDS